MWVYFHIALAVVILRIKVIIKHITLHTGSIDIEKQIVYMQQDGDTLRVKLISVMKTIVKMLIKQFTCGKRLIDIALPLYRQMGWDGINIFHPHKNVCLTCWHIWHLKCFMLALIYQCLSNISLSTVYNINVL